MTEWFPARILDTLNFTPAGECLIETQVNEAAASGPVKIGFIETGSGKGGSAFSLLRLLQAFRQDYGHVLHPVVIAFGFEGTEIYRREGFEAHNLDHHTIPMQFMYARNLFRKLGVSLIHCNNTPYTHKPFVLAAWSLGLPITVHVRSSRDLTHSEQFILRRAGHNFAVSQTAVDVLKSQSRTDPAKMTLLGDGTLLDKYQVSDSRRVDLRRALNIEDGRLTVLVPASLQPGKGQETVVDAASLLKQQGRRIVWLLAGGEHYQFKGFEDKLKASIAEVGVGKCVHLLGHRDDMPDLMAAADIVALPSALSEGLPCIVMEAMASGRPVLATNVGGIPESIDDSVGALIEPGDPSLLADAVAAYDDDRPRLQAQGEAARTRAGERFDIREKAATMVKVFQSLLGPRP